jgi:hypothetical protein
MKILPNLAQVCDDRRVGVEKVVSGHARLARNSGRDDDDFGVFQRILQLKRKEQSNLLNACSNSSIFLHRLNNFAGNISKKSKREKGHI